MRIIAGRFKGRVLRSFPGAAIRPTSDRLRETLFNILQTDLSGALVWDAFAGSGALGLEALSRHAAHVVFTERDSGALKLLRKNVALFGLDRQCEIIRGDALSWGDRSERSFDLIFLDPPYNFERYGDLIRMIGTRGLCRPQGCVIVEHSKRSAGFATLREWLPPDRQVRQGDSVLSFFLGESLLAAAENLSEN